MVDGPVNLGLYVSIKDIWLQTRNKYWERI